MSKQTKKRKKIVVIGAGSASFGLVTLAGIIRTRGLHGMELALVDINVDGANKIKKLAEILNEKWNANMKISATGDRREALPGADYIIISIAIDREECWISDYEIALKYNINHYAENGGPGAFAHSARNISIILPIIEDIQKLCPNAFVLNFTNPIQRICTAINKVSNIKFIGICHQIYFGYYILGTLFPEKVGVKLRENTRFVWDDDFMYYHFNISDMARKYFKIKAAGINHFTCMLDIREKESGEDIYGIVKDRMKDLPLEFEPLTQEIFRIFDLILVQGDCHIVEYLPYASNLVSGTFKKYDIQMYDFKWASGKRDEMWEDIGLMINDKKEVDSLKDSRTERAEIIIDSIEKNSSFYEEAVNIPNNGNIKNLTDGAIVEVPAIISGSGITGLALGDLPKTMAELCNRQLVLNEMTVQAVIEGNIKLVYQLFALDPMIDSLDTAVKLADEYIKVNIKYLPSFQ